MKISEFVSKYDDNSLTLGCNIWCDNEYCLSSVVTDEQLLEDIRNSLNIVLKEKFKDKSKYYVDISLFKLRYNKSQIDGLYSLQLTVPTSTLFKPGANNSLLLSELGLAFETAVEYFINNSKYNDKLVVNKSAESYKIEENVNINGQNLKFFDSYGIENSQEIYNWYGYFGILYLSKELMGLFKLDEPKYDAKIKEFQDDLISAVNDSLEKLGYENIKYDVALSTDYNFVPKSFKYIQGYPFHYSNEEFDELNIDFNQLMDSVLSILQSKYKNFEEIYSIYSNFFDYNNHLRDSSNIKNMLYDYLKYGFKVKLPKSVTILDKKSFYDFLINGTAKDGNSERDLILDSFVETYNSILKSNIKLKYFDGKYSDFIKEINDSTLAKAKDNKTSVLYFNNDYNGRPFIGVNILFTDTVINQLKDKTISRNNTKVLCSSFLRELSKN